MQLEKLARRVTVQGEELGLLRVSEWYAFGRYTGPTSNKCWKSGRLVGASQCVDKSEVTGVLPRGEVGERRAKEQRAADPAEGHGLLEADHRASWRAGMGHDVARVPSLSRYPLEDYIWWVSMRHGDRGK